MKFVNRLFRLKSQCIALAFFSFALSGCELTDPFATAASTSKNSLKPVITLECPDDITRHAFTQSLTASGRILVTPVEDFGQYRLVIAPAQAFLPSGGKSPLIGRLHREQASGKLPLHYTLLKDDGTPLASGELIGIGPMQTRVYPSMSEQEPLTNAAASDAARQLLPALITTLEAAPWQARVVGILPSNHISISAGQAAGIRLKQRFGTASSLLETVTFETTPTGGDRAVLRLLTGSLPAVGDKVQPR